MASSCASLTSKILFRTGQLLLICGTVCFILSIVTTNWVIRPAVPWKHVANPDKTIVTTRYGIFYACKQDADHLSESTDCGHLWENLRYVSADTVRFIQAMMVFSGLLYAASIVMEVIQFLPIATKKRNFLAMNRMVELCAGIAAVLILTGMVIFTGEVKNKAERVEGQDEETPGWSFAIGLAGLMITVMSIVLTVMFRDLPVTEPMAKGGSWVKNMQ